MRQCLSVLLALVLSVNSLPGKPRSVATLHSAQAPTVQKATLQEQVLAIPAGSLVEIRLKTKEKLRGRLVEVSKEAITVKVAKGDKIDERKLGKIQHIVVIYQENHSFDNLYGGWEGVNGRANADAPHTIQVGQAGVPYTCLRQNDFSLTSPPLPADCLDATTATMFASHFPNAP